MRENKKKIFCLLLAFVLIIQNVSLSTVFADKSNSIQINIGKKNVSIGDESKVSISFDEDYKEDTLTLTQICYDVTQDTTLTYNQETNSYEGIIQYKVEPETTDVWSLKEIKIGERTLVQKDLQNAGLKLIDYDVNLVAKKANVKSILGKYKNSPSTVSSESPYSGYTIVLDPGHGGVPGSGSNWGGTTAVNDTLWEKDYNLDTTLATAEYLRNQGVNVILTRDSDTYLSLSERSSFINQVNPDLALSIHYNGYEPQYNGTSAYYKYAERNGGIGKILSENVVDSIVDEFGFNKEGAKYWTYNKNGVLTDYLHMIRVPNGNVALVECCYLSNEGDQAKVNTKEKRELVGVQIAEGIIKTLDYMIEQGVKPNIKPAQVTGLNATKTDDCCIDLSWDKTSDGDYYKIYRSTSENGTYTQIAATKNPYLKENNLEVGTYYYKVRSYKTVDGYTYYGDYSDPLEVIINFPEPEPSPEPDPEPEPSPEPELGVIKTGVTTSDLNVRKGPSTSYDVLGYLPKNTNVQIVEVDVQTGWYKIKYKDDYAYVSYKFVTTNSENEKPETGLPEIGEPETNPSPEPSPEPNPEPELGVIKTGVTTSDLNVRKGPSTSYDVLGYLPANTNVQIVDVDKTTGWYKIKYKNDYAYVSHKFVTITETSTPETNKPETEKPSPNPQPEQKPESVKNGIVIQSVNIRKGPSTSYDVIKSLKQGTKVEVVGTDANTGWYKIKYNGDYAYVSNKYVTLDYKTGVTTGSVNARKGPSTSYGVLAYLSKGTEVTIVGTDAKTGWYKILYNNNYAYVSNKYVTLNK